VRFVGSFVEAPNLGIVIHRLPGIAIPAGPLLASFGLAMNFLADGFPGMPDGPHFSGNGEERAKVLRHGRLRKWKKCEREKRRGNVAMLAANETYGPEWGMQGKMGGNSK
jgi:hypothetical protein